MEEFIENLPVKKDEKDSRLSNVIVLAFVGDSLYCTYVRIMLATECGEKAGQLHLYANEYVKAKSQAFALSKMTDLNFFTEKELGVGKRARNSKLSHIAKNASFEDYRYATAFESILGYQYFSNQKLRLIETIKCATEIIKQNLEELK